MPDGFLLWYDSCRGEGRVVRGSREYPVRAADVEPAARVPGARVHCDVRRLEGVKVAANVRLRPGTRVSRRQRRFGDMTGARRPDTRGSAPFVDLPPAAGAVEVALEPDPAPALTVDQAVEWLDLAGEPFVFRNLETGRANVVYRRYDGHYGLIVPADEPPPPAEPATARRRLRDELARLEAVRSALEAEGLDEESEADSVGEMSTVDQHQADLATETFERERGQSLLEDVEQEIADVHRAFVRLDRGTYGRCEACGAQIPDERLVAMPATRFCLEHQAEAEIMPGLAT